MANSKELLEASLVVCLDKLAKARAEVAADSTNRLARSNVMLFEDRENYLRGEIAKNEASKS